MSEVFPGIEGQGFIERLDQVFHTREPFRANSAPLAVRTRDGSMRELPLE